MEKDYGAHLTSAASARPPRPGPRLGCRGAAAPRPSAAEVRAAGTSAPRSPCPEAAEPAPGARHGEGRPGGGCAAEVGGRQAAQRRGGQKK